MSRRKVGWHNRPMVFAVVMFVLAMFSVSSEGLGMFWFWMVLGFLGMLVGFIRRVLNPEEGE